VPSRLASPAALPAHGLGRARSAPPWVVTPIVLGAGVAPKGSEENLAGLAFACCWSRPCWPQSALPFGSYAFARYPLMVGRRFASQLVGWSDRACRIADLQACGEVNPTRRGRSGGDATPLTLMDAKCCCHEHRPCLRLHEQVCHARAGRPRRHHCQLQQFRHHAQYRSRGVGLLAGG